MNIPEIVAFHQEFKLPNVIDHLILYYCNKPHTIHELYTVIYYNYSVVSYVYIDKRVRMLKHNGLLVEDMLIGSDRELYTISCKGEKTLRFMDCWLEINKKKYVGNVT